MIKKIYNILLKTYSTQGWWPLSRFAGKQGFDERGYHRGNYLAPESFRDQFEVAAGAVLTQNTSWLNVQKALEQLKRNKLLTPRALFQYPQEELAELIRSSGYFNQKAKKLKALAQFFLEIKTATPAREALLNVWGIGPETADSILLYAYQQPIFVIDAYTKRIAGRIGFAAKNTSYADLQSCFQEKLSADYRLFNEYHALLVCHGKDVCKAKPVCAECCLKRLCEHAGQGTVVC